MWLAIFPQMHRRVFMLMSMLCYMSGMGWLVSGSDSVNSSSSSISAGVVCDWRRIVWGIACHVLDILAMTIS